MEREHIDLCGLWRAQPDPACEGEELGYAEGAYDHGRWREVWLPCVFDVLQPGLEGYEGAVWFRRSVAVPASWKGRRIALRLGAANYHAAVWVNGERAGAHRGGYLPFALPVGQALRYGAENTIAVCVDNVRRPEDVPGLQRGWRTFGGIIRSIGLEASDPLYLADVAVQAEPTGTGGVLRVEAQVENGRGVQVVARVRVHVTGNTAPVPAAFASDPAVLGAGQSGTLMAACTVQSVQAWTPESPNLYEVTVDLWTEAGCADSQAIRTGFRRVEAKAGRLLLNGRPVYLTGFNRHEDSPSTDAAVDLDRARADLAEIKAAGANFLRLCHYPHDPGELDLCDELGLLAMAELPLYWWGAGEESAAHVPAQLAAAEAQLEEMIRRDRNHPSVVSWSVSNESHEDRPEIASGNERLVRLAQRLDGTRLAVHVSDHWQESPRFDADDVVCVNGYPTVDAHRAHGTRGYDLSTSTCFWRDSLQRLHERYPEKPILVTEFGYPGLEGVYGSAYGEDVQAEALAHEFAGMGASYVCGATVWCWADHPWPGSTIASERYLAVSPYGVVTRDRHKLAAHRVIGELFRERQGLRAHPGTPGPRVGPAGYSLRMVRSSLDDIPITPFPEGYSIRPMRPGEGAVWLDVQRDAEPFFGIADDLFVREFGRDPRATQWRSFLVTNERGSAVGTVSAWYSRDNRGQDHGLIHWIAIRPAYQGLGLGKAALAFALQTLAEHHTRCCLGTQSRRLVAIKMYLDYGFVPDLSLGGAVEAWREVKAQLAHPVLAALEVL